MDAETWPRMWNLFHAALEHPPEDRCKFLDAACATDNELREQVKALLESHQQSGDFLESPAAACRNDGHRRIPDQIGPYRIHRVIGAGGMGVVYEAEQQNPRRVVALKVLRGGPYVDEHRLRLFQREVQSLARLKHPAIAAIYDAGCTDDGLHYFVMELVDGCALHEFIDRVPDMSARLELFCDICDAVSHAHQKGVIHRDLKPGNILVSTTTGDPGSHPPQRGIAPTSQPVVKILDFGLARLTDGDVAATTLASGGGHISGTLSYMSPEQTCGTPDEIDMRTDVYALGVILYELLTNQRPYDVSSVSVAEAIRRICHQPPVPPRRLVPGLPYDLEAIGLKALEKEPSRRYPTADALAEDVRRFQARQPVQARAPTALYQMRKLVERHRVVAGLVAVIVLLLAGLAITMAVQTSRVARERDLALHADHVSAAVNAFLNEYLVRIADPRIAGKDITVKDAIDNAARNLDGRFLDDPLVEASIRVTIGQTYRRLAYYGLAEPQLVRAADLRERALGADHPDTLAALRELAVNYDDWKRCDQATSLFARILTARTRTAGDRDAATLQAMDDLGVADARCGALAEAERHQRRALDGRRQLLGAGHRDTLLSMNNLAYVYLKLGRYADAEPLAAEALAGARRTLGEDELHVTLHTANTLAVILERQGRFPEAEALHVRTLAARRRLLKEGHPDILASAANLGRLYVAQHRLQDAEPLLLECAQALAGDPSADAEQRRAALTSVIDLYRAWDRPDAAAQWQARLDHP